LTAVRIVGAPALVFVERHSRWRATSLKAR